MIMRFKGKVILVTGGTSGMGLKTALLFAEEGGDVYISGRSEDKGAEAVAEACKHGVSLKFIKCNVADSNDVKEMIEIIIEKSKRLDCAINNAGLTSETKLLHESSEENWELVVGTNLTGTYLCMKYEIEAMLKTGGGVIVNNSSIAGVTPIPKQAGYVASKFGIIGLSQTAAIDYAQNNIRINVTAPGPIIGGMNSEENLKANPEKTKKKLDFVAMHRFGLPEEVAKTILWLCSDDASFITGVVLPIDGGFQAGKWN
jgi:NAD(P)-dependent dehydrogenase (short-subunit alcohol dehydrogenase family)